MIDFETYYKSRFRNDINRFFSTIPDESKFHEDLKDKTIYSIQYERLSQDFNHLDFLTNDEKINFGIALYLTILSDMVCFKHFKKHYEKFQKLTLYPKFIGNCPSGCHYHNHPNDIFGAINYSRIKKENSKYLFFKEHFENAIPLMENEIKDFFIKYLTEIDSNDFWYKCKNELAFQNNI